MLLPLEKLRFVSIPIRLYESTRPMPGAVLSIAHILGTICQRKTAPPMAITHAIIPHVFTAVLLCQVHAPVRHAGQAEALESPAHIVIVVCQSAALLRGSLEPGVHLCHRRTLLGSICMTDAFKIHGMHLVQELILRIEKSICITH
jgi:hypothetical protein